MGVRRAFYQKRVVVDADFQGLTVPEQHEVSKRVFFPGAGKEEPSTLQRLVTSPIPKPTGDLPQEDVFRTGIEDVAEPVKAAKLPDFLTPLMKGVKDIPGAALDIVKQGAKALVTAPQFLSEVPADEPRLPAFERLVRRLYETPGEILRGVGHAATAGLTEATGLTPPPRTEGAEALRTIGQYAMFPSVIRRLAGKSLAGQIAVGAGMGAAAPLVKGQPEQAIESATTGAGLMGAFGLLGKAFQNLKGRLPTGRAEIVEAMRDPAFVEEIKAERARQAAEPPPAAEPVTKPPRRILEDYEVSPSTYIRRYYVDNDGPGIRIPDHLKEEFGAWNRWHKKGGVPIDDIAEEMVTNGLLRPEAGESPLDALLNYRATSPAERKSAGAGRGFEKGLGANYLEDKIKEITESEGELSYKGKTYTEAVREGNSIRLKGDTDVVINSPEQIFSVGKKVPFEVPPEGEAGTEAGAMGFPQRKPVAEEAPLFAKRAEQPRPVNPAEMSPEEYVAAEQGKAEFAGKKIPSEADLREQHRAFVDQARTRLEKTEAGMQGVLRETPGREIPASGLKPKVRQTEKLTPLEGAVEAKKQPGLFDEPIPMEIPEEGRPEGGKGTLGMPAARGTAYVRRTGVPVSSVEQVNPGDFVYDRLLETPAKVMKVGKDIVEVAAGNDRWKTGIGNRLELAELMKTEQPSRAPPVQPAPATESEVHGFPEFRRSPKDVPQSIDPLERNFRPPAPQGGRSLTAPQPITRRGDIIRSLQDALQVPIRSGHGSFGQMKAAAFFKVKEEVIRLKKANDMEATAHEVGHYISKKFFGRRAARLPGADELLNLGHELYGSRKPHGGYAEEGFAEAIRFYVTNPAKMEARAPKFLKFLENEMESKYPDLRDTLQSARADWKRYQEQPAVARVLSQISVGENKPRAITLDQLYKKGLDDLHYIKVFEDRMMKGQPPLRPSDSPYTLARLMRGWVGKVDLFFKDGPIDFDTLQAVPGVKSLNEILAPFEKAGQLDDVRAYLTARSATDRIKLGQETGLDPADIQATLDTYNARPEFVRAAEDIRGYEDSLLNYAQKEGTFSKEQVEAMREAHPNHIGFMRVMEGETEGPRAAGSEKFANVGSPIKRAKGSAREIIDPLESLVKSTYAIISAVDRNEVGVKLVELAEKGEGMGKYVEKVPRDKIPLTIKDFELDNLLRRYGKIKETTRFQTSKTEFTKETGVGGEGAAPTSKPQQLIESRVKEALTARGFTEGEAKLYIERLKSAKTETAINSIIEKIITEQTIKTVTRELELDLPPEVVAAFRPNPKIPGMDNILSVRINGKPILYQVHPDLYESMAGLDRANSNALIKLLRLPAASLRFGAVVTNPEFGARNVVNDQVAAAIYSKYGVINVPGVDAIRGLFHIVKNDEFYQAWKAGGGEAAIQAGLDRRSLQKTLNEIIESGQWKGIAHTIIRHPIDSVRAAVDSVRAAVGFGEELTRVGEFTKVVEHEGGLSKDTILSGAFAARDLQDFQRMGSTIKATGLNQIVAFLNANIQAQNKMVRAFREQPGLMMARSIATITIPTLMLYAANSDDPRYRELPAWQRNLFWIIPTGYMNTDMWSKMSSEEKADFNAKHLIWRIPRAHTLGLIFGALPERALDWMYKNDPKAFSSWARTFFSSLPNPVPTALIPLLENFGNWSMFRDRRIIPRGKEDVAPAEQHGPFTSEAAKLAGRLVNYSPAKIENLLRGWFGAIGQLGLDVADVAIPGKTNVPRPERSAADIPMLRGAIARSPGQSDTIERFYDELGRVREIKNTLDLYRRERRVDDYQSYREEHKQELLQEKGLSEVADRLSALRKQMDRIRGENIPGDRKRQLLDVITFRMIDYAEKALKRNQPTSGAMYAPRPQEDYQLEAIQ